jgi:hypothetical protein
MRFMKNNEFLIILSLTASLVFSACSKDNGISIPGIGSSPNSSPVVASSQTGGKAITDLEPSSLSFIVVDSATLKRASDAGSNVFQDGKLQTTDTLIDGQVFCSLVVASNVKDGESYPGDKITPKHNTGFVDNAVSIDTAPKGDDVEYMSFICGTTSASPITLNQVRAALNGVVAIAEK